MAAPVGIGIAAGFGLAVGFGIGYFVAKARWADHYDKLAQKEIDEAREYYLRAKQAAEAQVKKPLVEVVEYLGYVKADEASAPEMVGTGAEDSGTAEDAMEANGDEDTGTATEEPEEGSASANPGEESGEDEVVIPSVSGVNRVEIPPPMVGPVTGDVWDYAEELKHRTPDRPYIIHVDEYGELEDEGYNTTCLSYYDEDEVLADDRDEAIDNVDELVGLDNLQKFGHGTDNADALMVRNEMLNLDIEILRTNGSFGEDVQGFLKHHYSTEKMHRRHERFDDDRSTE